MSAEVTVQQASADGDKAHAASACQPAERIGLIFVHGIGEQKRFEHLDAEIRPLIEALIRRQASVTVEILGGDASTLRAERDTWRAQPGASVRAVVREEGNRERHLYFHEVWWADVNEPYSLRKQVVFWLWGLGVWLYPNVKRELPGRAVMQDPYFPGRKRLLLQLSVRLRLFLVSTMFLLTAASVGTFVVLAKRLLDLDAPNIVRIFVNYLSAIKLYNQPTAAGGGFLDAYKEPPRVSVRRRMIRAMADVAARRYDRWYVLGHSLGSVVAYNGLMENSQAVANYLDEARWQQLITMGNAETVPPGQGFPYAIGNPKLMLPARPLWLGDRDVVRRDKLLEKFRGLLTYGSPLDKFAAIWPRRVPVNIGEPLLPPDAEWINVYDPTDPIAARLDAFSAQPDGQALPGGIPKPRNFGYKAAPWLLLSHIRYLRSDFADSAVEWVLTDNPFKTLNKQQCWLKSEWLRRLWTWIMWLAVFSVLLALAAAALPIWISWGTKGVVAVTTVLPSLAMMYGPAGDHSAAFELANRSLVDRSIWVVKWSMLTTLCIGVTGWTYFYIFERQIDFKQTRSSEEGYWASTVVANLMSQVVNLLARLFTRQK